MASSVQTAVTAGLSQILSYVLRYLTKEGTLPYQAAVPISFPDRSRVFYILQLIELLPIDFHTAL